MRTPNQAPETHFNFELSAWVVGGKFTHCGQRGDGPCQCYGCQHEGERENAGKRSPTGTLSKTLLPAPSQLSDFSYPELAKKQCSTNT